MIPISTPENPIFDISPALNIIESAQKSFLSALESLATVGYNATEGIVNQLRNLRSSFSKTLTSHLNQAIENMKMVINGTRDAVENAIQNSENRLLSLEKQAQKIAACASANISDTRNAIRDAKDVGYNCLANKLNEGIEQFNGLVENLTKQGTTLFSIPDQINTCNRRQSGLLDVIGAINRTNCLANIPVKVNSDAAQFFSTITGSVRDAALYANSIPTAASQCAINAVGTIERFVRNMVDYVANCSRN